MTIRMDMGLLRAHTLPTISKKVCWVKGSPGKRVAVTTELVDFNGLNVRYTSLRDLISPTQSRWPPRTAEADCCDLSCVTIKNQLVKQAAIAYLQPMIHESRPEKNFLVRCWTRLTSQKSFLSIVKDCVYGSIEACVVFFVRHVYSKLTDAFEVILERFRPHLLGFVRVRADD